jgi:hypothetical protein
MALGIIALGIMALGIMALGIMALGIIIKESRESLLSTLSKLFQLTNGYLVKVEKFQ